jgi:hypothetical protein
VSLENWQARYSQADRVWSPNPNPWLVETADQLVPGSAIDVGYGEGAEAIWLANQCGAVTSIDISSAALARAADHVDASGVTGHVDWSEQDLAGWDPTPGSADLVLVNFFMARQRCGPQLIAKPGTRPEAICFSWATIWAMPPKASVGRQMYRCCTRPMTLWLNWILSLARKFGWLKDVPGTSMIRKRPFGPVSFGSAQPSELTRRQLQFTGRHEGRSPFDLHTIREIPTGH